MPKKRRRGDLLFACDCRLAVGFTDDMRMLEVGICGLQDDAFTPNTDSVSIKRIFYGGFDG
jgi:hypothetical protein